MGKRPGLPEDNQRTWMSRSEFEQRFRTAHASVLFDLPDTAILHVRPSFWEATPMPDKAAVELFHYYSQRGEVSLDRFIMNFTENALLIRERIHRKIHQNFSRGRLHQAATKLIESEFPKHLPREGGEPNFTGDTKQISFGYDFYTGHNTAEIDLSAIANNRVLKDLVKRLRRGGLNDISEFDRLNASALLESPYNFKLKEIEMLARELFSISVFMYYPASLYYKLGTDIRTVITLPGNRSFIYKSRSQTYQKVEVSEE